MLCCGTAVLCCAVPVRPEDEGPACSLRASERSRASGRVLPLSSWGLFGVPGGVLSGLGRSWEGPWWPPRPGCATWVDFWIALGAQGGFLDRPGGPRGRQNGAQRRPKSVLKIDAKYAGMLKRS